VICWWTQWVRVIISTTQWVCDVSTHWVCDLRLIEFVAGRRNQWVRVSMPTTHWGCDMSTTYWVRDISTTQWVCDMTTQRVYDISMNSMSSCDYVDDSLTLWCVNNALSSWHVDTWWNSRDMSTPWEWVMCRRFIVYVTGRRLVEFVTSSAFVTQILFFASVQNTESNPDGPRRTLIRKCRPHVSAAGYPTAPHTHT